MKAIYDKIGTSYSVTRRTDPIIAQQLYAELEGATRIVNIGAGTGSYEPDDIPLVAVEPSAQMIAQRQPGAHPGRRSPSPPGGRVRAPGPAAGPGGPPAADG